MENLDSALDGKKLTDLQDSVSTGSVEEVEPRKETIEEAIKYLKWQTGCSETEGNEEYIGKGDGQICKKLGLSKSQLNEIRAALNAKVAELTPKEEI